MTLENSNILLLKNGGKYIVESILFQNTIFHNSTFFHSQSNEKFLEVSINHLILFKTQFEKSFCFNFTSNLLFVSFSYVFLDLNFFNESLFLKLATSKNEMKKNLEFIRFHLDRNIFASSFISIEIFSEYRINIENFVIISNTFLKDAFKMYSPVQYIENNLMTVKNISFVLNNYDSSWNKLCMTSSTLFNFIGCFNILFGKIYFNSNFYCASTLFLHFSNVLKDSDNIVIQNSFFCNNYLILGVVTTDNLHGIILYTNLGYGVLCIENVFFLNNDFSKMEDYTGDAYYFGCLLSQSKLSTISIVNCKFKNNSAVSTAPIAFIISINFEMKQTILIENSLNFLDSFFLFGIIYIDSTKNFFEDVFFFRNIGIIGACLSFMNYGFSTTVINNMFIYQNYAETYIMDSMFVKNNKSFVMSNSSLVENQGFVGGGMVVYGGSQTIDVFNITHENMLFYNNYADHEGGSYVIKTNVGFKIYFYSCNFSTGSMDSSRLSSIGILSVWTEVTDQVFFEKCIFFDNVASSISIMSINLGRIFLNNSMFFKNVAKNCIFFTFII